ncbi:hypothetical protein [Cohnella mopanensis]|nr:hypothetical protein [Cohnella mopanensis]
MAKNKKQKLGQNDAYQAEFASESNVSNNTQNKAAQKKSNSSDR